MPPIASSREKITRRASSLRQDVFVLGLLGTSLKAHQGFSRMRRGQEGGVGGG